jgi:hypothetical protein
VVVFNVKGADRFRRWLQVVKLDLPGTGLTPEQDYGASPGWDPDRAEDVV